MKIYRQIVGNHSCSYVIKGKFKDKKIAQKVQKDIGIFMKLLRKFDDVNDKADEEKILEEIDAFFKIKGYNLKYTDLGVDWEEEFEPRLIKNNVIVNLYTSGDGIDEITKIMKKNKGKVLISDENDIQEV